MTQLPLALLPAPSRRLRKPDLGSIRWMVRGWRGDESNRNSSTSKSIATVATSMSTTVRSTTKEDSTIYVQGRRNSTLCFFNCNFLDRATMLGSRSPPTQHVRGRDEQRLLKVQRREQKLHVHQDGGIYEGINQRQKGRGGVENVVSRISCSCRGGRPFFGLFSKLAW